MERPARRPLEETIAQLGRANSWAALRASPTASRACTREWRRRERSAQKPGFGTPTNQLENGKAGDRTRGPPVEAAVNQQISALRASWRRSNPRSTVTERSADRTRRRAGSPDLASGSTSRLAQPGGYSESYSECR